MYNFKMNKPDGSVKEGLRGIIDLRNFTIRVGECCGVLLINGFHGLPNTPKLGELDEILNSFFSFPGAWSNTNETSSVFPFQIFLNENQVSLGWKKEIKDRGFRQLYNFNNPNTGKQVYCFYRSLNI